MLTKIHHSKENSKSSNENDKESALNATARSNFSGFVDRRTSTGAQLNQQQIMNSGQSPNIIQRLAAKELESTQRKDDSARLENNADAMGGASLQMQSKHSKTCGCGSCTNTGIAGLTLQPKLIVQRYCGAPGCNNPKCDDPKNHNISNVRRLRSVDIYSTERDKSNLGKGSGTNQNTRDYVQDPNSFYPEEVSLSYTNQDGSYQGGSSYVQPPRTPGMKPDAGHIFGNQYGGSGTDTANIFAQEPKHNRGNSHKGEKTFHKWRKTENEIRKGIEKGRSLRVTAKLHRKKRKKYDLSTLSHSEYRDFLKRWLRKRDDDNNGGSGGGSMIC